MLAGELVLAVEGVLQRVVGTGLDLAQVLVDAVRRQMCIRDRPRTIDEQWVPAVLIHQAPPTQRSPRSPIVSERGASLLA